MNNDLQQRYNTAHPAGKHKQFYLQNYMPNEEESRFILLKVVEQAVRDYVNLIKFLHDEDIKLVWEEAKDFLFDDDYSIDWGEKELYLLDILNILEIDIEWFRNKTRKRFEKQHGKRTR